MLAKENQLDLQLNNFFNMFGLLLFLCLYLPFQIALNPVSGIDLASVRIIILFLFFAWLAQGLKDKKIVVKKSLITASVFSFLFLSLLSAFFAGNLGWSERKLLYLFSIFPIFFAASALSDGSSKILKIIKSLVFSGALVATIGIVQFFSQFIFGLNAIYAFWSEHIVGLFLGNNLAAAVLANPSWLVNISGRTYLRAVSLFPDPHMFSLYLGLLLPLAVGLNVITKKNSWLMLAGLIFIANILTFSRGGYIGIVGAILVLFVIFFRKINIRYRKGLAIAGFLLIILLVIPNPISFRFFSSFNAKEGSNAGRLEMWGKAAEVIEKNPVLGVGIGNYSLEVDPLANYRNSIYAHNVYLDIMAESGILAGLAWLGMLIFSIVKFVKRSRNNPIFLFVSLSLIIFSLHSFFENGLYSPVVLTLFLIIISLAPQDKLKTNEKTV